MLTVSDTFAVDAGTPNGWTLEICVSGGGVDFLNTLSVNDLSIAAGTYQAGTQLTFSGSVPAGNMVTFPAGNNIELLQNFTVQAIAIFEARIEGCQ